MSLDRKVRSALAKFMDGLTVKDIFGLCINLAGLEFAVFGFVYSLYAQTIFQYADPPPIVRTLKNFSRVLVAAILVLTIISISLGFQMQASGSTWWLIACLTVPALYISYLAIKMH
jgi:hypothetical protein